MNNYTIKVDIKFACPHRIIKHYEFCLLIVLTYAWKNVSRNELCNEL
jgi:hypothetical protein